MIQRIQSAYLLLAVVLMGVTMSMPLGLYVDKTGAVSTLYAYGMDVAEAERDVLGNICDCPIGCHRCLCNHILV